MYPTVTQPLYSFCVTNTTCNNTNCMIQYKMLAFIMFPCKHEKEISFLVWLNPTIFPLLFKPLQITKWASDKELEPQFSNSYPLIAAMQPFIQDQSHMKHSSWMAQAITERMCLSVFKATSIMCAAWPRAPCTPQPRWLPWQLQSFLTYPNISVAIITYH